MKKISLIIVAIIAASLVSCSKDWTCTCTNIQTQTSGSSSTTSTSTSTTKFTKAKKKDARENCLTTSSTNTYTGGTSKYDSNCTLAK